MSEASSPIGMPQPNSPQGSLTLSLSPTWEVLQVIKTKTHNERNHLKFDSRNAPRGY